MKNSMPQVGHALACQPAGGRPCIHAGAFSILRKRLAHLESPFDGDHGEEKLVWVILDWHKFVVKIEGSGGLVQSFHYHANRRYLRRGSPTSVQGIHQEKSTEVSAPARTTISEERRVGK